MRQMGTEIQTVKSQMTLKNWVQEIAECQSSDMRKGIDGLATIVQGKLSPDPFSRSLYLFCGRNRSKIKGLLWEGDGFLLLY